MKFAPLSVTLVLYVIVSAVDALYQSKSEFDFVDTLLSTEKVLSYILIYFSVWIVPRVIWPKIVKWLEDKSSQDHKYRMAELKVREAAEEQQMILLMKLIQVGVEVKDLIEHMSDCQDAQKEVDAI